MNEYIRVARDPPTAGVTASAFLMHKNEGGVL